MDTPSGRILIHERNNIVKPIDFTSIKDFFRTQLALHFEDAVFDMKERLYLRPLMKKRAVPESSP